jgi:imidazolonepropionase-like amidohydrolase
VQFSVTGLRGVVEHAHDAGLPVTAHAHPLAGIRNALAAGVDGIEHFTGLAPGGPRIDDALLEETARRGVRVDLTMGIDPAQLAALPEPPPPLRRLLADLGFEDAAALHDAALLGFRRLRKHGVVVVAGVDSGIAPPKQHGNAWRTVGELVDAGYPVDEALAAATSVAAETCGLAGTTGRLATGLAADLLVVDGDLAQDPARLATPREVVVRGGSVVLP